MLEVAPEDKEAVQAAYAVRGLSAVGVGSVAADRAISISIGAEPSISGARLPGVWVDLSVCLLHCLACRVFSLFFPSSSRFKQPGNVHALKQHVNPKIALRMETSSLQHPRL